MSWQWQRLWWEAFAPEAQLELLLVHDGPTPNGIVPLARYGERLRFACGSEVSDFLDLIAPEHEAEQVVSSFVDWLAAAGWPALELCCAEENSVMVRYLAPALQRAGRQVRLEKKDVSPFLMLPASWDDYLRQLSKKDRHELRRKKRHLDANGKANAYVISGSAIEPDHIADFLALHRASTVDKAAFMNDQMEAYFRRLFVAFAGESCLRLYFMEIDGQRVAALLAFDSGNEILLYNSGYLPAFGRLSVGVLLKAFAIDEAIHAGRRKFDFLRGNERYKYDLGAVDAQILSLKTDGGTEL